MDSLVEKNRLTDCYRAGYDSGLNGANTRNCHFSLFSTPERTKEWERGNRDGIAAKDPKPAPGTKCTTCGLTNDEHDREHLGTDDHQFIQPAPGEGAA